MSDMVIVYIWVILQQKDKNCGCSDKLPKEKFAQLREQFQNLSKKEQDAFLMAQLINTEEGETTTSSQTYFNMLGISLKYFESVKDHFLNEEKVKEFLEKYAQEHGQPDPSQKYVRKIAVDVRSSGEVVFLPTEMSYKSVHDDFVISFEKDNKLKSLKIKTNDIQSFNHKLTSITSNNKVILGNEPKDNVNIMVNAQEWLDRKYPKEGWIDYKNTPFYHQYQKIKEYNLCQTLAKLYKQYRGQVREIKPEELEGIGNELYSEFCQKNNYRDKMINTKEITTKLQQIDSGQLDLELNTQLLANLQISEDTQEQSSLQAQIQQPPK
ncbi:12757_t:CDS:2 [Cetraspora pellucida]|uniref:12757_t:CDS:1 n=1 Tax=Cetraspora pellucida TaxID=1433469 RepID=A0ACA9LY24_9GLOM|nr:12757_t:CDS:2 [Cetraspora pellucida]